MTTVVHPHASIALYLEGRARVWCGASHEVRAGDVLLVPEGMPHYTESCEGLEILGLSLCTSCLSTSSSGVHLMDVFTRVARGECAVRRPDAETAEKMKWLLESLAEELEAPAGWDALAVEGLLAVLTALVRRTSPGAGLVEHASANSVVGSALAFIASQATEGISLVDVARHVHRSRTHTASLVKAETGLTVVEWITHTRLATARQLLLHTDDTVEAIADRVGFASVSHFHRTFRREMKATPGAWRSTHRVAMDDVH